MKLGRLGRLFNIIKTTEHNKAGCVMSSPLCYCNRRLLIHNNAGNAGYNVLTLLDVLAEGEKTFNHKTRPGKTAGR